MFKKQARKKKGDHSVALRIAEKLWSDSSHGQGDERRDVGPMHAARAKDHIAAKKQSARERLDVHPYAAKRVPSATLYGKSAAADYGAQ